MIIKKYILLIISIILSVGTACSDDIKTTDINVLPGKAQKYLANFNSQISLIEIDKQIIGGDRFEVLLVDGTEIDFNAEGEWTGIDCKAITVPSMFVPKSISNYITQHFPNLGIKKIEKDSRGYDVELTNGIDLKFDQKGVFLRIDD